MKCNVGPIDQILRIIVGVVIIYLGLQYDGWWGILGAIPLISGIMRLCPFYALFGISTCHH